MAKKIDAWFVILGAVFLIAGMALGEVMGASNDHSQMPTHAHLNLPGGVFAILYGLAYRAWPAQNPALPLAHFWIHVVGSMMMVSGLFMMFGGVGATGLTIGLAAGGGGVIAIGMIVFLIGFAQRALKS